MTNWDNYRKELRNIITNSSTGILISADHYSGDEPVSAKGAGEYYFQLSSGKLRKEFISIWELFDERQSFRECMEKLAEKALEIRRNVPYKIVVTCTDTAKELINHIQPVIEIEQDIVVSHFGHYPSLAEIGPNPSLFLDASVLILTDVVASGKLVRMLIEILNKLGAKVAAVLAVVLTNQDMINKFESTGEHPTLSAGDSEVILHSLTHYAIPDESPDRVDPQKIVKVDHISIFPQEPLRKLTVHQSIFSNEEMYRHFIEANALDFGCFIAEDKYYTLAIRMSNLLSNKGKEIWSKIRFDVDDDTVIVCTYKKEELRFLDYVLAQLGSEGLKNVPYVILKRDTNDSPQLAYTLYPSTMDLKGKKVILLRTTVSTSEELKNIVALLTVEAVKSIKVICLINRLGVYTTEFIRRIEQLLAGLVSNKEKNKHNRMIDNQGHTLFEYLPVYSIIDLRKSVISKMNASINLILDHYHQNTNALQFKKRIEWLKSWFSPKRLTSRSFENGNQAQKLWRTRGKVDRDSKNYDPYTLKKLCDITSDIINRKFASLLQELKKTDRRNVLYHLYRLLISDIDFIRISTIFKEAREILIERIDQSRNTRLTMEKQYDDDLDLRGKIDDLIQLEIDLIVGIAFLAFFDDDTDYTLIVHRFLFNGMSGKQWNEYPINMELHFSNSELNWASCFVLHSAIHDFYDLDVTDDINLLLNTTAFSLQDFIIDEYSTNGERMSDETYQKISKIRTNFDSLFKETGAHRRKEKHEIIRFLHRMVISDRVRHNRIHVELNNTITHLEKNFSNIESHRLTNEILNQRISIQNSEIQKLDQAVDAMILMQEIANAVRDFYRFTPNDPDKDQRYISGSFNDSFSADVDRLYGLLMYARETKAISFIELSEIKQLKSKLLAESINVGSRLRTCLNRYVVPLEQLIIQELKDAEARLTGKGYLNVWKDAIEKIENEIELDDIGNIQPKWIVLIDPGILKMVLRNLFYNVRHSFKPEFKEGRNVENPQKIAWIEIESYEIEEEELHPSEPTDMIQIRVYSVGKQIDENIIIDSGTTFSDQQYQVSEYGGELYIQGIGGNQGTLQELYLVSRMRHYLIEKKEGGPKK